MTLTQEHEAIRAAEARSSAFLRRVEAERQARAERAREQRRKQAQVSYEI